MIPLRLDFCLVFFFWLGGFLSCLLHQCKRMDRSMIGYSVSLSNEGMEVPYPSFFLHYKKCQTM